MGKLFQTLLEAKIEKKSLSEAVKNLKYKVTFPLLKALPIPYVEQFADEFVDEKGAKLGITGFALSKKGDSIEFAMTADKYDSTDVGALTGAFKKFCGKQTYDASNLIANRAWTALQEAVEKKVKKPTPEWYEWVDARFKQDTVKRFLIHGESALKLPQLEFLRDHLEYKSYTDRDKSFEKNEDFYSDVLDVQWPEFELMGLAKQPELFTESIQIDEAVKNVKIKIDVAKANCIADYLDAGGDIKQIKELVQLCIQDSGKVVISDLEYKGKSLYISTNLEEAPSAEFVKELQNDIDEGIPDVFRDHYHDEIEGTVINGFREIGVKDSRAKISNFLIGGGMQVLSADAFQKMEEAGYEDGESFARNMKFWNKLGLTKNDLAIITAISM